MLLASQARPRSPRAGWTDRDAVRRPSSLPDAESPHARKMSTMEAEKRTKESRTRRSGGREFANGSHVKKCWNGFVPSWTNLTFSALLGPQGRRCDAEARATDVSCQLESRLRRMRDFLRGERTPSHHFQSQPIGAWGASDEQGNLPLAAGSSPSPPLPACRAGRPKPPQQIVPFTTSETLPAEPRRRPKCAAHSCGRTIPTRRPHRLRGPICSFR